MAYEVSTVQITNPDNPNDYIVIAQKDFDPKTMELFKGATPEPVLQDDPQPEAYPDSALIAEGLDLTVSKLGPWLGRQTSIEMLTRLQTQETRRSALALIKSRLATLQEEADRRM
jgi:hypothetical protein